MQIGTMGIYKIGNDMVANILKFRTNRRCRSTGFSWMMICAVFGLMFLILRSAVSEPFSVPSEALPGVLKDILDSPSIEEHVGYISRVTIGDSYVSIHFLAQNKVSSYISLTVSPNVEKSREVFRKIICPAAPNRLPVNFGDERMVWGESGKPGATISIRRDVLVVAIIGGIGFDDLLKIAKMLDNRISQVGVNVVAKELLAFTSSERLKRKGMGAVASGISEPVEKAKKVSELIAKLNGDVDSEERPKIICQLLEIGDANAVPVIITNLEPKFDPVTREKAAQALGKFRDKRAIAALVRILERPIEGKNLSDGGPDENLRRNAVAALEEIGDPSVILLLERIASDGNEYITVKDRAKLAVDRIGENRRVK